MHDYLGFAAKELQYRRWMRYPPAGVLANVIVQAERLEEAMGWSALLGSWFGRHGSEALRVMGPAAAPIVRLKRIHRYHLVLKAESRSVLQRSLHAMLAFADAEKIPRRAIVVDVDAISLM